MRPALIVLVTYAVAGAVALLVGHRVEAEHPIAVALWADLAATAAVFAFSLAFRNSSLYDPYWSVAPLPMVGYLVAIAPPAVPVTRQVLVVALVVLWGVRLTWNWARGWPGLHHEDWRYVNIRGWSGRYYWLASLVTIHLMPTAWVFGGLLSAWVALSVGERPLNLLDGVAAAIVLGAIAVEAEADRQLARYKASRPPADAILESGVWRVSRHPNYFGELSFWWGLFVFALAADPGRWWVVVGPLALTGLFVFISLPLIERRMIARRPHYVERQRRVSAIVPWFPRS